MCRGNNGDKSKYYTKVAYAEAKDWMAKRLARGEKGMPATEALERANTWAQGASLDDIDPKIMEIEANIMQKQWERWHVPSLGNLTEERPEGVHRFMLCQMNSTSSVEVRDMKLHKVDKLVDKYDV